MKDAAGSVLVCAVEGTALTTGELSFYERVAPSGVTLFTRNIPEAKAATQCLTKSLQATRPSGAPPLVVAIDQEGGRVERMKSPAYNPGAAMFLAQGQSDQAALAEIKRAAQDLGAKLLSLGINVNFAPVCDVLVEPTNSSIGDRAFAMEPESARVRAAAFLEGLQASGVKGCLKHFPGQGAAKVDTHLGGAVIDIDLATLRSRELVPFATLLKACDMVMVSHCIYPALANREASRAPEVMQKLLRHDLGFSGVVVSDDMNMGALPQDLGPWREAIIDAVMAGADMLLVCRHIDRCWEAYEALRAEGKRSSAFAERLEEAAARVLNLRSTLAPV